MGTYIKAISYYLPDNILSNEDIAERFPEWSVEKITNKTGIKSRRHSNLEETSLDLAYAAAEKLFQENEICKESIDFVIFCTQTPDYFLPSGSCILQDRLGLKRNIGAFDINLGCSGYVYGLGIAKGLLASGQAQNVLFLTGETYTKLIHPEDKGNLSLFGDGGSATLLSSDSTNSICSILDFEYGTDGSGSANLIVRSGGFRKDQQTSDTDACLFMNGSEIFNFTAVNVPLLVKELLKKNDVEKEDIDQFVFHQANRFMLDFIRKKIGISAEKFYYSLETTGNTVSATIPIALKNAVCDGTIQPGNKVVIAGFGVGYSWGGTILQF